MVGPVTPQHPVPARLNQLFVGRSAELSLLETNLAWAAGGEPRVVVVEGPAGIGKSSLLRSFLASTGPDVRSLMSSGEGEGGQPLGVLQQLLRSGGAERSVERGTDPLDAGAALVDLLGAHQVMGPVVVVVDDAHWADDPSLRALTFALRRMHTDRVMALLVRQDGEPKLPEAVCRLADARGQWLRLRGLDAVALAELAARSGAGRLSVAAAERFHHHTRGNPLHARALLDQLDPVELRREAGPLPAPGSYAMVMVSRLAACSPATQALVTAASVLGDRFPLPTAARLAGLDDPSPAVEEAVRAHLVWVPDQQDDRWMAFAHPLVRSAVYQDLDSGRRTALHARAATVTAGPVALDHRVKAAVGDDAGLAMELTDVAAMQSRGGAPALAARHLLAAARLDPSRREDLVLDAGGHYLRGGETDAAAALVEQVPADSPRRRSLLGHLALVAGRREEARILLEAAWADDLDLAAAVATQLGELALAEARAEDALTWGRRALESAGDQPAARSAALAVVALGLGVAGRGEEALRLLQAGPVATPEVAAGHAEQVFARGVVRYCIEDLHAAAADLTAVSRAGAGSGLRMRIYGLACLAKAEYRLGQWDDSVGHADLAVSLAEDADSAWALALCRSVATMALAARGDWERAGAHARAAGTAAAASGTVMDLAYAAGARAQLAFARADPAGVVAAVEPLVERWGGSGVGEASLLPWREQQADALVSLGRLDEAVEVLAPFEAMARARVRRSALAGAARVRGRIEAARGRPDDAESAFEEALAYLEGVPSPFPRALVEEAHGRHLLRSGQRRAAAAHLRSALATYADLGARPFLERGERELAACGSSPAPRHHPARVSLTPQELATARLAASGPADREVAAELVVSVPTVEGRLRNVYAKLGISSRHRLAAALTGRDLGWQDQ